MKQNPQKTDENNTKTEKIKKTGFFKKVWYSIDKIEKYSELSAEGFPRAITYLAQLVILLAIVVTGSTVYKTYKQVSEIAQYINDKAPAFTYKDEKLEVNTDEVIIDESTSYGKVIVDTKQENQEEIDKYIDEIPNDQNGIVILNNKLILKQQGIDGTVTYNYKDLFGQMGINEFNNEQLIEYLTTSKMSSLYLNLFVVLIIYSIAIYFINILMDVVVISIFGYLASLITKLKLKYKAIFNMAVYSITLSTLLNILYIAVNTFFNYNIQYFEVMYILVSSIYMIAAIFILKSEFTKKQGEVTKIVEVQEELKEETKKQEENEKQEEEKRTEKPEKKKKNNKEEKEGKTDGGEPEGSNA